MYTLTSSHKKILADTYTPVSLYLKIRDKFPNSILLESSDYHGNENSFSFICFNKIAHIKLDNNEIEQLYPDGTKTLDQLNEKSNVPEIISNYISQFKVEENDFKFISNGLFGYSSFEAVEHFEDIKMEYDKKEGKRCLKFFIPLTNLSLPSIILKANLICSNMIVKT